MDNLVYLPATDLLQKIKSKELSVVHLIKTFLNHIEKHNPSINAICELRSKTDLLKEAQKKDNAIKNNNTLGALGALHGLPITVKDSILVKGLKASNGDPLLKNRVAKNDAELVKRLKDAGAIILGKTNTALFCIDWQSTNSWNGQTNNPYDVNRVPGGSSGGSAAAIASGFSALDLGADAGGSVRVPAHFCGIFGLRPTEFLLSNRGHVAYPNKPKGRRHIITPGPFAKNTKDLKLIMSVLGNNSKYPLPEIPQIDFTNTSTYNNEKLSIAVSETINAVEVDAEYLSLFRDFINLIKNKNTHSIKNDHPVYNEEKAYVECSKIIGFELGVSNPKFPLMQTFMYSFIKLKYNDHLWAKGMALGQRLSNTNYAKAIDYKNKISEVYNTFLTQYDIWITPVCAMEAYKHQKAGKPFIINGKKVPYTKAIAAFNFTIGMSGHPIVVIPIGKKKNGMPVGVQIHSKKWTDQRLLDIAEYFEKLTYSFQQPRL